MLEILRIIYRLIRIWALILCLMRYCRLLRNNLTSKLKIIIQYRMTHALIHLMQEIRSFMKAQDFLEEETTAPSKRWRIKHCGEVEKAWRKIKFSATNAIKTLSTKWHSCTAKTKFRENKNISQMFEASTMAKPWEHFPILGTTRLEI